VWEMRYTRKSTRPPDATKRECKECRHLKAALTWWCESTEAREHFGTPIPGREGCPFWEPMQRDSWRDWFNPYIIPVTLEGEPCPG
jgi:hypothetical protein